MLHLLGPNSKSNESSTAGAGLFPELIAIISLKLEGVGITIDETISIKLCLSNFKNLLPFSSISPKVEDITCCDCISLSKWAGNTITSLDKLNILLCNVSYNKDANS